jgi:hypothetical protein
VAGVEGETVREGLEFGLLLLVADAVALGLLLGLLGLLLGLLDGIFGCRNSRISSHSRRNKHPLLLELFLEVLHEVGVDVNLGIGGMGEDGLDPLVDGGHLPGRRRVDGMVLDGAGVLLAPRVVGLHLEVVVPPSGLVDVVVHLVVGVDEVVHCRKSNPPLNTTSQFLINEQKHRQFPPQFFP